MGAEDDVNTRKAVINPRKVGHGFAEPMGKVGYADADFGAIRY